MNKITTTITKKLKILDIKKVCILKDTQWKFGLKSQLEWFKKNIKLNDVHILLKRDNNLIGYTLLRKRTYIIKSNLQKSLKFRERECVYWYFDTHIVKKNYRGMGYNRILMKASEKVIKNYLGLLICSSNLINYYKKFQWKLIKLNLFKIIDHPFSTNAMLFNQQKIKKIGNKVIYFYINK
jgi:hypothetical protein